MNAQIDITDVRLETERLILRPWEPADATDMFEYSSVHGVGEMAGWVHHGSLEVSQKIIDMFRRGKKTFALELKENGKVIGSLGIEELDPDPVGEGRLGRELGYVLSKEYWGRGLMPEAVRAVISYCFDTLHLDYLTCGHFSQNHQSSRVIEKCGFICFGESQIKTDYGTVETSVNYILFNPKQFPEPTVDISNVQIDTQRLLLRPLQQNDLNDFYAYCSVPGVGEMAGWPHHTSIEESQEALSMLIDSKCAFALELKDNCRVIGTVCIDYRLPDVRIASGTGMRVDYDLSKEYWGRGLMPEAVQAVTRYCFEQLHCDYITCNHFLGNYQSQRVIEKCGFQFLLERDFPTKRKMLRERLYILYNK